MVDQDEMVRILGMETYILPLGCLHRAKCEFNTGCLRVGQERNELCEVGRYSGNREQDSVLREGSSFSPSSLFVFL